MKGLHAGGGFADLRKAADGISNVADETAGASAVGLEKIEKLLRQIDVFRGDGEEIGGRVLLAGGFDEIVVEAALGDVGNLCGHVVVNLVVALGAQLGNAFRELDLGLCKVLLDLFDHVRAVGLHGGLEGLVEVGLRFRASGLKLAKRAVDVRRLDAEVFAAGVVAAAFGGYVREDLEELKAQKEELFGRQHAVGDGVSRLYFVRRSIQT